MVDVVTELPRECVLSELLCDVCLLVMGDTIDGLRIMLRKWKETFESNDLNVRERHQFLKSSSIHNK